VLLERAEKYEEANFYGNNQQAVAEIQSRKSINQQKLDGAELPALHRS
jgi:hypothetical protein